MTTKIILFLSGLAMFLVPLESCAEALSIELSPSALTYIYPENGKLDDYSGLRILVKFDIPDSVRASDIINFNLVLNGQFQVEDQDTTIWLTISPLASEWQVGTVGWDNPWFIPGGDFDSLNTANYFLNPPEPGPYTIDLKRVFAAEIEGDTPDYGFIIIPYRLNGMASRLIGNLDFLRSQPVLRIQFEKP
jgi:hypothetical protein